MISVKSKKQNKLKLTTRINPAMDFVCLLQRSHVVTKSVSTAIPIFFTFGKNPEEILHGHCAVCRLALIQSRN